MLTPRIESVINENAGKVKLAKVRELRVLKVACIDDWTSIELQQVDIDELTDLSLEYDVQAVPVLAVMKNGKIVNRIVGLQDTDKLRKWVTDNIK